MKRFCLALCLLLSAAPCWAQVVSRQLDDGWRFRLLPGDAQVKAHPEAASWHKATVPGSVHTDLLAHALIPDPYVGAPEAELQWIGLADWEYVTRFDVDEATLARPNAELVFDGVDTLAEMSLNGKPLLNADNSHRTWRVRVDKRLKARKNELRIVFRSPIRALLPQVQAMPHKIAGNYPSPYGDEPKDAMVGNFVRKPGYHFGWDWGPRYVTAGLWRPVRLETWKSLRVTDLAVTTQSLDEDEADLAIIATVDSAGPDSAAMEVEILDPDGQRVGLLQRSGLLVPGENRFELTTVLRSPRRWWPAGYGEQARYRFRLSVRNARGDAVAAERLTGLRSVELRRDRDADGQGFAFVINGVPIFAKGANVIPFDAFPARVDRQRIREVLQSARDANMNMLRNWGGGYYEDEAFYDIADELGLLVWQDFMFGGGMQPAYEPLFRANVVAEARDNIRRLRHHPSIVLWCGNNEEETAWKDWGHGKTLREADPAFADRVWQGYVMLFGRDLRRVVHEEALGVPYWSSSPSNDLDEKANDSRKGDKHYWEVWGAPAKPVQAYQDETPRFMSEFGLQAWPVQRTVDAFATRAEQAVDGPVIRAHQKFMAGAGNERLLQYIQNDYGTPRNFSDFIYLSQVMQAEGIELAALHHRASRPYTMGSLYWQLNDVWPGASWSSVDYYGRWKALQFHARRFFAPVAVAASRRDGEIRLTLVSDRQQPLKGEWRLRVLDFNGKELRTRKGTVTLPPLSATQVRSFKDSELLRGADAQASVAVFEFYESDTRLARQLVYFDAPKSLKLPTPAIQTELERDGDGYRLRLQSTQLVRALWIDFGEHDAVLSDNSFDLLPGEAVTVSISAKSHLAALRTALHLTSLADVLPPPASSD